jgi:hypothetical protein
MRPRLTFANVASAIAVFIALGGTTLATHPGGQNTISTADIINGEVKVADVGQGAVATDEIANGQVKAADIGDGEVKVADIGQAAVAADELATNSVGTAEIATGAVRTEELANGQVQAEDLAPGVAPGASGARAWGLVSHLTGALLRQKNVTAVTNPSVGVYCIDPGSGIDPATAVMVVGEDFAAGGTDTGSDDVSHAEWNSTPSDCPAGTMEVRTSIGFGSPASGGETDLGGFELGEFNQPFSFVIP